MIQLILWIVLLVAMIIVLKFKLWNKSTWKTFFVDKNKNYIPDVLEDEYKKLKSKKVKLTPTPSPTPSLKCSFNVTCENDETLKEEIKSTVNRAKKTGDQIDEIGEQSVTRSKKRKETSF